MRAWQDDVVIVGGGPAGASSACLLASQGYAPLVLEREPKPRHKICGEFISIEAQRYLSDLGIDPRALGGARIRKLRLVSADGYAEATLPFEGIGLTRHTLDEALLKQAGNNGARIRRGVVATAIVPEGAGFAVRLRGKETLRAKTVFLATGKHDLHTPKRPSGHAGDDLIGFKTYWSLAAPQRVSLNEAVEIILFKGGYAGLQAVEDGQVNLCLLVKRAVFETTGRSWEALLGYLRRESPHLRDRLEGAEPLLEKPLTIANVPYGYLHRPNSRDAQGLFRLGDQMGVIPSFCGDGVAIALHTGRLASMFYAERGGAASDFHARARRDMALPIGLAGGLYHLSCMGLGHRALILACRLYPGILGKLATWTRVHSFEEMRPLSLRW
jgi:menaquinone-9 beta-reductase